MTPRKPRALSFWRATLFAMLAALPNAPASLAQSCGPGANYSARSDAVPAPTRCTFQSGAAISFCIDTFSTGDLCSTPGETKSVPRADLISEIITRTEKKTCVFGLEGEQEQWTDNGYYTCPPKKLSEELHRCIQARKTTRIVDRYRCERTDFTRWDCRTQGFARISCTDGRDSGWMVGLMNTPGGAQYSREWLGDGTSETSKSKDLGDVHRDCPGGWANETGTCGKCAEKPPVAKTAFKSCKPGTLPFPIFEKRSCLSAGGSWTGDDVGPPPAPPSPECRVNDDICCMGDQEPGPPDASPSPSDSSDAQEL